jgi:hypothetical protein
MRVSVAGRGDVIERSGRCVWNKCWYYSKIEVTFLISQSLPNSPFFVPDINILTSPTVNNVILI